MPTIKVVHNRRSILKHCFSFPDLKGEKGGKEVQSSEAMFLNIGEIGGKKWGDLFHGYISLISTNGF